MILYLACGHDNSGILLAMKGGGGVGLGHCARSSSHSGTNGNCKRGCGSCSRRSWVMRVTPVSQSIDRHMVGVGILHHLQDNLQTPCSEVARVLVPNGFGVFSEPIAQSNALKRIRNRVPVVVPASVSPHRQPPSTESFDFLRSYFRVDAEFFEFFGRDTRLILHGAPLENAPPAKRLAIFLLHQLDRGFILSPEYGTFGGSSRFEVIIEGSDGRGEACFLSSCDEWTCQWFIGGLRLCSNGHTVIKSLHDSRRAGSLPFVDAFHATVC
jgi:hypothetical protein